MILVGQIGCLGYGPFVDPSDAYRIESEQCRSKPDAEAQRRCQALTDKKYARYFSEGGYPSSTNRPGQFAR